MPRRRRKAKPGGKKAVDKSDFALLKETIQIAKAMTKAIEFQLSLRLGEFDVIKGVKLLPTIMACVGADQNSEYLLAEMFRIVRSSPILFQYAARECDQDVNTNV